MNSNSNECQEVLSALKNTSKGRLSYDRHWKEERRTQDIISDVKLKTSSLTISPKCLRNESQNKSKCFAKYKVMKSSDNETIVGLNDNQSEDKTNDSNDKSDKSWRMKKSKNKLNETINDLDLILYEKQRQESVGQELNEKIENLKIKFRKCEEEFDEELKLIRQKYALDAIKRINAFADDYKALKESIFAKQMSFEDNSMITNFKLKEIESKHQLLVEEQQRKQTDLRRKQLLVVRNEIDLVVKSVVQMYSSLETLFKNNQYFHTLKQELNAMNGLLQNIDILLTKHDLNEFDSKSAQTFQLEVKRIEAKIMSDIETLKLNNQKPIDSKPNVDNISDVEIDNSVDNTLDTNSDFVDIKAFKEYLHLQKMSNDFENSFKCFLNEIQFKQKRNELQLFVKTTINTISCESVDHIKDKLNRLTQLFNQRHVEYGGKQLKCTEKDGSLNFCISLASKMFVSVSTKQKDIALTMAPIVVLLWSRFPTFGQIFLAQMQEKCPYVVPYYPKPEAGENETNYLIACGYTVGKDGSIESEESFVNRMRAMIRLYSAVIQSNVEANHPHGLRYGWIWVSRVLNSKPRPLITAAVLESFLSISSHKFYRFYGKQFIKIIEFIFNDYIKRIESVAKKDTKRQSLVKLEMFCQQLSKQINRNVNHKQLAPEGLIPDYFFQTSYSHSRGTLGFH